MGVQLVAAEEGTNFMDMVDTVSFTDSEVVYHVRNALKDSTEGVVDMYNQLVGILHHNRELQLDEVALLVTSLKALSGAVSCIDAVHHRSLLAAICGMSLWDYSTDVMDALIELLISLVGSSGQYLDLTLDTLVRNFMPPTTFLARNRITKDNVVDRVHSAFKHIHDLVPLSAFRLEKIIQDRLPNIYIDESLVVIFVENMLRLESSDIGEFVGNTMLAVIVDRLVDLDVEISWDDILQENFNKGIFEMELEELEDLEDEDEPEIEGIAPHGKLWSKRFLKGDLSVAQKLDSLMVLIFEHLKCCSESGRLHEVFKTLLKSFRKTVMTAYKSKFAQFVMFYACSLDPDDCGTKFAFTLIDIFKGSTNPGCLEDGLDAAERRPGKRIPHRQDACYLFNDYERMSSVAYLASYLSRAKFVSASFVADMIERLVVWCSKYCGEQDGVMNPNAHKVFYGACQAIMYVLCFRLKQIIAVPRLRSVLVRVNHVFKHPLNPLKVCLPSIVEEFLRVAQQTPFLALPNNLVTTDGMLESDLSVAFGGKERLDMFFPFDPCLLNRTDRYIRPNFVYWSMVDNTLDDDEDNEATSDEEVDDIHTRSDDKMMEGSADDDDEEEDEEEDSDGDVHSDFDYSLDKMSITPKNLSIKQRLGGELRTGGYMQMPSRIRPSTSPESL